METGHDILVENIEMESYFEVIIEANPVVNADC
jgi:hypothetical protein